MIDTLINLKFIYDNKISCVKGIFEKFENLNKFRKYFPKISKLGKIYHGF